MRDAGVRERIETIIGRGVGPVAESIELSAFQLEEALGTVHLVKADKRVRNGVERLVKDVAQLLINFTEFKALVCGEGKKS